jgi:hypothetical protein
MSRQLILTLAAAASVAAASVTLGSSAVYARGMMGGGGGGGHFSSGGRVHMAAVNHNSGLRSTRLAIRRPIRHTPIVIGHLHHHHHHWVFRGGRWIVLDGDVAEAPVLAPAAVAGPGPCTCLTKTYTPEGLVVFADVCTKESASAPVEGDAADASKAPTSNVPANATPMAQVPTKPNYAGRSYDDYLAANPQLQPQAAAQQN